jgi:hypothetical protein
MHILYLSIFLKYISCESCAATGDDLSGFKNIKIVYLRDEEQG